jgi:hypothetical protein
MLTRKKGTAITSFDDVLPFENGTIAAKTRKTAPTNTLLYACGLNDTLFMAIF